MTGNLRVARFFLDVDMRNFSRIAGAVLSLLLHAAAWADAPKQPEAASGFVHQQEARGRLFMAVTANRHATDAAVEILHAGGTAVRVQHRDADVRRLIAGSLRVRYRAHPSSLVSLSLWVLADISQI